MALAIAKSAGAIALVSVLSCKGANAPGDAPIVVSILDAGSFESINASADDTPIDDAGAVVSEAQDDEVPLGPVGDKARHEIIALPLQGFYRVLSNVPVVTVTKDGVEHDAQVTPPFVPSYFLDGVLRHKVPQTTCIDTCRPAKGQHVDLVDYVQDGKHAGPDQKGPIPVFHTIDLKGSIKIRFEYFADSQCRVPKVFTKKLAR